jgi:restriction system protein
MKTKNADHGLFVSWGGFKDSVRKEGTSSFFQVRLWDRSNLLSELLANYDRLPQSIQAELPLRRIWVVAGEEEL